MRSSLRTGSFFISNDWIIINRDENCIVVHLSLLLLLLCRLAFYGSYVDVLLVAYIIEFWPFNSSLSINYILVKISSSCLTMWNLWKWAKKSYEKYSKFLVNLSCTWKEWSFLTVRQPSRGSCWLFVSSSFQGVYLWFLKIFLEKRII